MAAAGTGSWHWAGCHHQDLGLMSLSLPGRRDIPMQQPAPPHPPEPSRQSAPWDACVPIPFPLVQALPASMTNTSPLPQGRRMPVPREPNRCLRHPASCQSQPRQPQQSHWPRRRATAPEWGQHPWHKLCPHSCSGWSTGTAPQASPLLPAGAILPVGPNHGSCLCCPPFLRCGWSSRPFIPPSTQRRGATSPA